MKSKFYEELKRVSAKGSVTNKDINSLSVLANQVQDAGKFDLSAGLQSNINFTVKAPTTRPEFFEDGIIRFNDLADEAVRKQVQAYVAGANIFISLVKAGIAQDPTAMLSGVNSIINLIELGTN